MKSSKILSVPSVFLLTISSACQELHCTYHQICLEDPGCVLEKLLLLEQPDCFRKAQSFIRAQGLGAEAVAELLSSAVVQALLASTQELQPGENTDQFHDCVFHMFLWVKFFFL